MTNSLPKPVYPSKKQQILSWSDILKLLWLHSLIWTKTTTKIIIPIQILNILLTHLQAFQEEIISFPIKKALRLYQDLGKNPWIALMNLLKVFQNGINLLAAVQYHLLRISQQTQKKKIAFIIKNPNKIHNSKNALRWIITTQDTPRV